MKHIYRRYTNCPRKPQPLNFQSMLQMFNQWFALLIFFWWDRERDLFTYYCPLFEPRSACMCDTFIRQRCY